MSSLGARLTRLEQRLGGPCTACSERQPHIKLVDQPHEAQVPGDPERCPECDQPAEVIRVLLAFDHDADEPPRQPLTAVRR